MTARRFPQRFRLIGRFPGKAVAGAAEVAEGGRLAVYGTAQVQLIDHAGGSQ